MFATYQFSVMSLIKETSSHILSFGMECDLPDYTATDIFPLSVS